MAKVEVDIGVKKQRFKKGLDELLADARRFNEAVAAESNKQRQKQSGTVGTGVAEKARDVGKELAQSFAEGNASVDVLSGSLQKMGGLLGAGIGSAAAFGLAATKAAVDSQVEFAKTAVEMEKVSAKFQQGLRTGNAEQIIDSIGELNSVLAENQDKMQNAASATNHAAGAMMNWITKKAGGISAEEKFQQLQDDNERKRAQMTAGAEVAIDLIRDETRAIELRQAHRHREAAELERTIALNRQLHAISQKGLDAPTETKLKDAATTKSVTDIEAKEAEQARQSGLIVRHKEAEALITERIGQNEMRAAAELQRKLDLEKEIEAIKMQHLDRLDEHAQIEAAKKLSEAKKQAAAEQADYTLDQANLDAQVAQLAANFQADAAEYLARQIALHRELRDIRQSSASQSAREAREAQAIITYQEQAAQQRIKIAERDQKLAADLAIAQKKTVASDLSNNLGPRARATLRNQIAHDELAQGERELAQLEKSGRRPEAAAKRKEIEGLRQSANQSDFELSRSNFATSAVASSRASLGLGGGVAIFGGDTQKRQLTVLEQINAALQSYAGKTGATKTATPNFAKR